MSKITVTTIAGATSGSDANKVIIESGDTLQVDSNATVGGTLGVTGATTLNGGVTLGGTTPTLTIGDAGAEDTKIVFDGNAQDFHIGLDDSADDLVIGKGSALGTTTHMSFDENGQVTKPLQCFFNVGAPGTQSNISNSGYTTITLDSETFDIGSNFASNVFTAPVTGKYLFSLTMRLDNVDTAVSYYNIGFNTSNRSHFQLFSPGFDSDPPYYNFMKAVIVDMDANDTANVQVFQNGGTAQTDINNSTRWYGYLLG